MFLVKEKEKEVIYYQYIPPNRWLKIAKKSCKPQNIVDGIEAIDNNADKLNYIQNVLDTCSLVETPKKKRGMSGYNCYIKTAVKLGENFKEVVKSKSWSQLEPKAKETWSRLAKNENCPPRLWKKKL